MFLISKSGEESPVWITTGVSKTKDILSINTNPLDNKFCLDMAKDETNICSKCYSIRAMKFKKHLAARLSENGKVLSEIIPDNLLPHLPKGKIRFQSHGELLNLNHLLNLIRIAQLNPHSDFVLFTKRKDLVNQVIHNTPNLKLIYSATKIDVPIKKTKELHNFNKVFNVITDKKAKINCSKECAKCGKCWNNKSYSIFELLK